MSKEEKQIRLLEVMIEPASEVAYLFDKSGNYELSYSHHQFIITTIDKIRSLKRLLAPKIPSYDFRNSDNIFG
jgi:hypothetical protein